MTLISIALLSLAALIFVIYFGTRLLGKVRFLSCRGAFFRGVLVLLILIAMLLGYFKIKYPEYSWHQKLAIEVETPSGLKGGASVVSLLVGTHAFVPGGARGFKRLRGEATVVEVAPGQYLFGLLKDQDNLTQRVFDNHPDRRGDTFDEAFGRLSSLRETRAVPKKYYPLLVTFTDINDPSSVQRVDPDDLATHFGPGVKLKTITLEITNEPVTRGRVEKVLGWLDNYYNKRFDGKRFGTVKTDNPFANSLASGAFDTEKN